MKAKNQSYTNWIFSMLHNCKTEEEYQLILDWLNAIHGKPATPESLNWTIDVIKTFEEVKAASDVY